MLSQQKSSRVPGTPTSTGLSPTKARRRHLVEDDERISLPSTSTLLSPTFISNGARRATNALTTKEVHDGALDTRLVPQPLGTRPIRSVTAPTRLQLPSLASAANELHLELTPKPLNLRKVARNITAPGRLQNVRRAEARLSASSQADASTMSSRRGEWFASLDTAARLIASGSRAGDVASIMSLKVEELVSRLAVFCAMARDDPILVGEEIDTFFQDIEQNSSKQLMEEVLEEWSQVCEEDDTLLEEEPVYQGDKLSSRHSLCASDQPDDDEEDVYYDVPPRPEVSLPSTSFFDRRSPPSNLALHAGECYVIHTNTSQKAAKDRSALWEFIVRLITIMMVLFVMLASRFLGLLMAELEATHFDCIKGWLLSCTVPSDPVAGLPSRVLLL